MMRSSSGVAGCSRLVLPSLARRGTSIHDAQRCSVLSRSNRNMETVTTRDDGRAGRDPYRAAGDGLRTMIGTFDGHRTIFDPGGTGSGARGVAAYFPDDSLAGVLLANAEPVDLDRVEAAITAAWYGASQPSRSQ